MPKLIRFILHVLQLGALLTGVGYALSYVLINEGAWSGITSATLDQPYGAIMFGILAIALSPSLWSSRREHPHGPASAAGFVSPGSYEAVTGPPPSQPEPPSQPGYVDPTAPPSPTSVQPGPGQPAGPPPGAQNQPPPIMPPPPVAPPQSPAGGGAPQAGSGYPVGNPPGGAQSQFAPRPGESGGPENSPPDAGGSLQNPRSPWS